LPVEGTGLIAGNIKLHVFLVDSFVTVHAILLWIVIHGVIPPVEQRIDLCLVHWVAVVAPGIFSDQPAGDIIDLAIALEGIQYQEEPSLVIVLLVNSCRKVWFEREELFRFPTSQREEKERNYQEDGSPQLRRCHNRLTINTQGGQAGELYHGFLRPSTGDSERHDGLGGDPCSHHKDLPIMAHLL
jgi:hypothetical protein